ncbi:GRAS family protein TF80-like [Prosopis cineraria]|uniref:GRAS family protein TF80-like n=1 Tax=Prosopis cineraria TaxID=364024 RepID=UPI00240F069C|nr:GRAS family protein TF80-like [Prosopis cineraria]XP_054817211.1 GRAS family protein TF80-like [Prosopis cineraria]
MEWEAKSILMARLLPHGAKLTETGDIVSVVTTLQKIATLAAPDGDALQRVATYANEGLAYRTLNKYIPGLSESLRLTNRLSASELVLVRRLFRELCPFLMFSYWISNHAIAEAMRAEPVIHVIDFNASDPEQWIHLLHTLKDLCHADNRPLPFLKITGIHEKKEVLEQTGFLLMREAEKLKFPFFFYPFECKLENLMFEKLPLKPEEPLAIVSVLQLHSLLAADDNQTATTGINSPAELLGKLRIRPSPDSALSPCASPKMECFLNAIWNLKPRLMLITEQESNANEHALKTRLENALIFYGALFDCLEANVPKAREADRTIMERMLLGEEIKNIIACEGVQRKERHEKAETWVRWLELAGFQRRSLSYARMLQATRPLQNYGRGYKLIEHDQCLFVCWDDRPLYSISAWKF